MNLPGHRVQWGVIVEIIRGDPRQSITALYVTGMPFAQSTMTIVDGAVVDAISRKPVHLFDFDPQIVDNTTAD
jgi:hypothetical protein